MDFFSEKEVDDAIMDYFVMLSDILHASHISKLFEWPSKNPSKSKFPKVNNFRNNKKKSVQISRTWKFIQVVSDDWILTCPMSILPNKLTEIKDMIPSLPSNSSIYPMQHSQRKIARK